MRWGLSDSLTPVYIDLDIVLGDELRRVATNLGTQYTCWFLYSFIYWPWHWPQRCIIHSCSQPWHPIYMRGTGLGCLGFITQEQTTVNRLQGDHFQQTNIINDNLHCLLNSILMWGCFSLGWSVSNSQQIIWWGSWYKNLSLWKRRRKAAKEKVARFKGCITMVSQGFDPRPWSACKSLTV